MFCIGCREEAKSLKEQHERAAHAATQAGEGVQLAERKLRSCFPHGAPGAAGGNATAGLGLGRNSSRVGYGTGIHVLQ